MMTMVTSNLTLASRPERMPLEICFRAKSPTTVAKLRVEDGMRATTYRIVMLGAAKSHCDLAAIDPAWERGHMVLYHYGCTTATPNGSTSRPRRRPSSSSRLLNPPTFPASGRMWATTLAGLGVRWKT